MVLVLIDNYDSFTWNVYQYLCSLGANVRVFRNDQTTVEAVAQLKPTHIVISPGPGHPSTDAGISKDVIRHFAGRVPVLGVCMGQQCIYEVFGGTVAFAGEIVHGKTSPLEHDGHGLFRGVAQGVQATRYHSLAGDPATLPSELMVTARTASGVIEGVRHRRLCVTGVQFHPESILSEGGMTMLENFLKMHAGTWAEQPEFGVVPDEDAKNAILAAVNAGEAGKTPSILRKIQQQRILDVAKAKAMPGRGEDHLRALVERGVCEPALNLYQRLRDSSRAGQPAVMAEVKRASPSKGNIDIEANAGLQARRYAEAGAAAISVLTEPTWFKGRLEDMRQARDAVAHFPNRPAILRKDFIVDTYQIYEARLYGADTVLLIVAILTDTELTRMLACARAIGMEPLVEVNSAEEMRRALAVGSRVIGVNNRSLHTFHVDPSTTTQLADLVPSDVILAALSGITARADVEPYLAAGASAVLVGEALMRAADPGAFIRSLSGTAPATILAADPHRQTPRVKICGVQSVEAALAAAEAGADFIGIVFAKTRRCVPLSTARAIVDAVRATASPSDADEKADAAPAGWFDFYAHSIDQARRPLLVGVFQNQSAAYVTRVAREVGLDMIQLHGDEPTELARLLPLPVIRAFHVPSQKDVGAAAAETAAALLCREVAREGYHALSLLDALVPGAAHQGGQGVAIDWSMAERVIGPADRTGRLPVILAGGLTAGNVAEAVQRLHPWAVDVSSGVETQGSKDLDKIRAFVKAAKASRA
ncbi:putative anthranilate synthase [Thamnocephalis sphaerospora]|uniref:Multifunctional tryptophan biosynthesis protein n=1 Tax=Thamnocephalis sphaerospora TaxID=78915 RepID=A0A4V1IWM5_9FUNG|nr:putative anthranilate synthase [Thamnocephalis sphaerospora]|eukprot:RKP08079.1 putative anthranilate synthase [Thamnocephalis sphaerospora]